MAPSPFTAMFVLVALVVAVGAILQAVSPRATSERRIRRPTSGDDTGRPAATEEATGDRNRERDGGAGPDGSVSSGRTELRIVPTDAQLLYKRVLGVVVALFTVLSIAGCGL